MERSQRIARINVLLRQKNGVTMEQLKENLSVSRATINRDLELMRSEMYAPIEWDRDDRVYRLNGESQTGPAYMLPGLWFSPQQAYAFLTMQNIVEKIAPNLLGPFLDPIRKLLKEMLWKADFPLYGLDRKIEIDMPAMPPLNDLDFQNLLEALVNDQTVQLAFSTPSGDEEKLIGMPQKLRIAHDQWVIDLLTHSTKTLLKINVTTIKKVVLISGGDLEKEDTFTH